MARPLQCRLHYCLVGGVPVFLDVARDRYFRLGVAGERAFLERASTPIRSGDVGAACLPDPIDPPRHSVVEHGPAELSLQTPIVPVTLSLVRAWRLLRLGSFARAIAYVGALGPDRGGGQVDDLLIESASAFDRARRLMPTARICLLDSIALAAFLHRRRRYPRLVVGVTLAPFAAHCWLQAGDWVLNECVDHAASFTPILIV